MWKPRRFAGSSAFAAALVIGVGIGGCGSSGGNGSLSRAQLIKKGDAICKRHTDVITAGASKLLAGGKLPSPAKFGQFAFGTIIPQYTAQIAQLSALKPPSSMSGAYKTWLTNSRATLAKIKTNPVMIQQSGPFASVNHQSDALGFSSDCHVGPGS